MKTQINNIEEKKTRYDGQIYIDGSIEMSKAWKPVDSSFRDTFLI